MKLNLAHLSSLSFLDIFTFHPIWEPFPCLLSSPETPTMCVSVYLMVAQSPRRLCLLSPLIFLLFPRLTMPPILPSVRRCSPSPVPICFLAFLRSSIQFWSPLAPEFPFGLSPFPGIPAMVMVCSLALSILFSYSLNCHSLCLAYLPHSFRDRVLIHLIFSFDRPYFIIS